MGAVLALASCQLDPRSSLGPEIDLSYVQEQMTKDPAYAEWCVDRLQQAIDEYRRYLALCRMYPEMPIGISRDADQVWHRHILNTRRYAEDCQSYFGYFFHHTPESTAEENEAAQRQADRLHLGVFGVKRLPPSPATCVGSGCMNNG